MQALETNLEEISYNTIGQGSHYMQYQREKFINAILFFATHTDPKKFGITKLVKLLFFADFLHFEKYGRPIVGDQYYHLPQGPVPTTSYDLYKNTFEQRKKTGLEEYIKTVKEKVGDLEMQKIEPLQGVSVDENVFSESDLEVMREVAKRFYDATGTGLAKQANEIPFVKETPRVLPIDYLNVIKDKEDREYLAALQRENEEIEGVPI